MAKNKGQYLLDGTFQQWLDIDAYHKGVDTFDLAIDETDGLLYLQINGQNVGEGVEITGGGGAVRYNVSYTIPHVTSSNVSTKIVEGRTFTTQLTADQDFEIKSVTVTMGGVEMPNAYNAETGIVTVSNVTGDLAIVVVSKALVIFNEVQWIDTAYGIGDNSVSAYNAWCPGCAKYDETLGKVIFLQCHSTAHAGNFSKSQLWAIDPYNVMDSPVLLSEFPVVGNTVPLAFDIYDGAYYAVASNRVYKSLDRGATWTTTIPTTAPSRSYCLKIIDDVMYLGDDGSSSTAGTYYTSTDWGLNWATNTFDFVGDYDTEDMTCSEAEFIKFNGRIFASLRRGVGTGKLGMLAVLDNGAWKVISEELPNVNSDCFLFATDSDVIAFAAIDRPNTRLKLGTISVGENDVATVSVAKNILVGDDAGDCHTPTYVVGTDFHMVTLMAGQNKNEYQSAANIAYVGYTDLSLNKNPSYERVEFTPNNSDISDTPYYGTFSQSPTFTISAGSVINLKRKFAGHYPLDEDGNVYTYLGSRGESFRSGVWPEKAYDAVEYHGKMYACVDKSVGKRMFSAVKQNLINLSGKEITPADGVFDYAAYCDSDMNYNFRTRLFTGYNWYATLVEPQNVGTL